MSLAVLATMLSAASSPWWAGKLDDVLFFVVESRGSAFHQRPAEKAMPIRPFDASKDPHGWIPVRNGEAFYGSDAVFTMVSLPGVKGAPLGQMIVERGRSNTSSSPLTLPTYPMSEPTRRLVDALFVSGSTSKATGGARGFILPRSVGDVSRDGFWIATSGIPVGTKVEVEWLLVGGPERIGTFSAQPHAQFQRISSKALNQVWQSKRPSLAPGESLKMGLRVSGPGAWNRTFSVNASGPVFRPTPPKLRKQYPERIIDIAREASSWDATRRYSDEILVLARIVVLSGRTRYASVRRTEPFLGRLVDRMLRVTDMSESEFDALLRVCLVGKSDSLAASAGRSK